MYVLAPLAVKDAHYMAVMHAAGAILGVYGFNLRSVTFTRQAPARRGLSCFAREEARARCVINTPQFHVIYH